MSTQNSNLDLLASQNDCWDHLARTNLEVDKVAGTLQILNEDDMPFGYRARIIEALGVLMH